MGDAPLSELEVLIVDCQTTGASPAFGSILELGWCIARADQPEREAQAEAYWIVPPAGERISAQVRALTGFHESVLETALTPEAAWQRLRSAAPAAAVPAAIHFARFELSFLRDWCARFENGASFPIDAVCVHAIACRLYPDLPRRNLRALAGFLGHGLHLERRSLGHVQATAFIWRKLVETLAERDIRDWSTLGAWLASAERPSQPRRRRYPLAPASYRSLPDQPGVYRFLRSNGDVLYVGKATSLKRRVSSHFTKHSGATERALEMLTQVSEVAFTATTSALEAALLETSTIKQLNPPYNVQLVQGERGVWFASPDLRSARPEPDTDHTLGPLSSRFAVRALGALGLLLAGEPATTPLRAEAVGAPTRFAPDPQVFAGGFALFSERHLANVGQQLSPRSRARKLAHALLLLSPEEPESSEETPSDVWDEPRVCRHLERAIGQSYRALRRANWLCLLANSSVLFREPSAAATVELTLDRGSIVDFKSMPRHNPAARDRRSAQLAFDAALYDFLRILTTELKRILRDGGEVSVRLSGSRVLAGARLERVLRVV
jgi:DNA polymerase-3 subunit epsilon